MKSERVNARFQCADDHVQHAPMDNKMTGMDCTTRGHCEKSKHNILLILGVCTRFHDNKFRDIVNTTVCLE